MSDPFLMSPVGHVRCDRTEAIDDDWDSVPARIELDTSVFDLEALMGLETFSHAEVIFLFDQVPDAKIVTGARHPRGNTDWPKIGIFAQRGKNRPNRLGATVCEILSVDGTVLHLKGLDAIDGTPVLDIKPVMSGFQPRGTLREPGWSKEIMETYW
ncbi:SAM-dependent methyltransferase [Hyphomonas oceanitis]|uniref:Transcriptional regulator n=1 Tax=Hyphomonas oceanitis SCH89 TaxID=1280953 RepID=A0A059GBP2_9PROT|nr:SAM-dependent methyltransferase [Hyphomonas oceanitis]KDA03975.1 transcriptional regulator [Hyphomonas oceanitis SCH89]